MLNRSRVVAAPLLALAALASACGGGKGDEEALSKYPELEACTDGLSNDEIYDQIRLVDDYNRSLHELVACGAMTSKLMDSFQSAITGLITGGAASLPDGIVFDEAAGLYLVTPSGYTKPAMSIAFYSKIDSSLGKAGELIKHDVLAAKNYLVGVKPPLASISNPLDVKPELKYDSAGPLVELLGFGATPDNPIKLTSAILASPKDLVEKFPELIDPKTLVDIDDTQSETSKIKYTVESPPESMFALWNSKPMSYEVKNVAGARADLSQALANTKWTLEFVNGNPGALNGTVEFKVTGGKFAYLGYLTYQNTKWGKASLYCADTTRPEDPPDGSVRDADVEPRSR